MALKINGPMIMGKGHIYIGEPGTPPPSLNSIPSGWKQLGTTRNFVIENVIQDRVELLIELFNRSSLETLEVTIGNTTRIWSRNKTMNGGMRNWLIAKDDLDTVDKTIEYLKRYDALKQAEEDDIKLPLLDGAL